MSLLRFIYISMYLNDILIFSSTWEEYISYLTKVLETLRKHKLLANIKKREFSEQSLINLGYVIGRGELKINLAKK